MAEDSSFTPADLVKHFGKKTTRVQRIPFRDHKGFFSVVQIPPSSENKKKTGEEETKRGEREVRVENGEDKQEEEEEEGDEDREQDLVEIFKEYAREKSLREAPQPGEVMSLLEQKLKQLEAVRADHPPMVTPSPQAPALSRPKRRPKAEDTKEGTAQWREDPLLCALREQRIQERKKLEKENKSLPRPSVVIGRCARPSCPHGERGMEETDAHMHIQCSERCTILYHFPDCWRATRRKNAGWSFLSSASPCATDSCSGSLRIVKMMDKGKEVQSLLRTDTVSPTVAVVRTETVTSELDVAGVEEKPKESVPVEEKKTTVAVTAKEKKALFEPPVYKQLKKESQLVSLRPLKPKQKQEPPADGSRPLVSHRGKKPPKHGKISLDEFHRDAI